MKIVVVGAGNVGFTVADTLSSVHDVLVIEEKDNRAETVKDLLNVSVLRDDGTNPKVLKEIIETYSADVIISTLSRDDSNLFVSMIAKSIKPEIKTVARIRNPDFIIKTENGNLIGADQIMSPEQIAAKKMATLSLLENAVEYEALERLGLAMATFQITKDHTDLIGKVVINLPIPKGCSVLAIYRNEEVILFNETTELHSGDRICVLGSYESLSSFNQMIGVMKEAKEVVILGGGVIGSQTAKILEANKRYVKIIEKDPVKCKRLSREFTNVLIVNADAVDPHNLKAESVGRADVLISATDSDEKNLLAGLISMEMGAQKVISRYTTREYEEVFDFTGIKIAVGFHLVIANEITKTLIADEHAMLRMKHEGELFFRVNINETVAEKRVGDIRLPSGARIACIIRGEEKIFPRLDTILRKDDKMLVLTYKADLSKLNKVFGTDIS